MPPKGLTKKQRKAIEHNFQKAHGTIPDRSAPTWTSITGSRNPNIAATVVTESTTIIPEPPTKKQKTVTSDQNITIPDMSIPASSNSGEHGEDNSRRANPPQLRADEATSKPYGISHLMQQFIGCFNNFLGYILSDESDPKIGSKCACRRLTCSTRCLDCYQYALSCELCFIETHKNNPTHWAGHWNGKFFDRRDISDLRFVITFGHNGGPCPCVNYNDSSETHEFTLADVNGIHSTRVVFCCCAGSGDRMDQLMKARIFPASTIRPVTGFTFNLLKAFHIDCLESKKSAYDYVNGLRRRTNNAFPNDVPNVYKQFLVVIRVWRALTAEKRGGQAHGEIDKQFPGRARGSVIVPCFACPEPGFNMDDKDMDDEDVQHATTLFLSADGHFGLTQKSKNNDPDDVSLLEGKGFFPPEQSYQDYVKIAGESKEKCTCAKLNVVNAQNKSKFRGCRCSGIVAVNCARHNIFQHGAIADLQKGEKYSNTDHALAGALKNTERNRYIRGTYDVACQFAVKIEECFTKHFPEFLPMINRMLFYVPKLHIQGHKDDCQYRWSLNYSKHVGRTDGERIEPGWGEAKQAGGMTKEMNTGHRHDTLTDFQNDWNWKKAQGMTESLKKHLLDAKNAALVKLDHYIGLSLLNGRDRVTSWSKLSTEARLINGEWYSVFRYKEQKLPSQAKIYRDMLNKETKDSDKPLRGELNGTPVAIFLNSGLKIQGKQRLLKSKVKRLTDGYETDGEIGRERSTLSAMIKRWRVQQGTTMTSTLDYLAQLPVVPYPEDEVLGLPSDFTFEQRKVYKLEHLGQEERRLRQGEANDAIRDIRSYAKYCVALTQQKNSRKNAVHGQSINTRYTKNIWEANHRKLGHMERYRASRGAMISLGMAESDSAFPELKDEDVWMKDTSQYHTIGDGKRTEGWIWRVGVTSDMSKDEQEEYAQDSDRVQWFRARADMERWQEEVEILSEEFRRSIRGFEKMAVVWTTAVSSLILSRSSDSSNKFEQLTAGKIAYAEKQAAMYQRMAEECRDAFAHVGGTWPTDGVLLGDHIRSERPSQEVDWKLGITSQAGQ